MHSPGRSGAGDQPFRAAHQPQCRTTIFGIRLPGFDRDDTIGYEYTEWVLRPDAQLYVHGEASDRPGELAFGKPEQGLFLISTRTEEEIKTSHVRKQNCSRSAGWTSRCWGSCFLP